MIGGGVAGLSTARALVELGVTDVLVLERDTVGSGGSGKSSGIVRCHYGIASLAAMAWRALPVLEHATEVLGAPSGYTKTGYLVGVGPAEHRRTSGQRRHAALTRHRGRSGGPRGGRCAVAGRPHRRLRRVRLRAPRRLRRRPPDRHGLRCTLLVAAGSYCASTPPVAALEVHGRQGPSVSSCADGSRIGAAHVVVAAGPWSVPLAAGVGIDLPVRAQRAQILLVDPGRPLGPLPVFSDLVSLQYVRTEGTRADPPRRLATTPTPSGRTPTCTASG